MNRDAISIIGAGSFGTALANLVAENHKVQLYIRRPSTFDTVQKERKNYGQELHPNIKATNHLANTIAQSYILILTVPSAQLRGMMRLISPFISPDQIVIHGIKGFDIHPKKSSQLDSLHPNQIHTMSQVIRQESSCIRVGCLSGPNLSAELAKGEPAGAVIASHFQEVIREGMHLFRSPRFQVFGSEDLLGIELAGVLKNIIAIGAGMVRGLGFGFNSTALLVTKGLSEMVEIGKILGSQTPSFLGLAGIGDLMATCSSPKSRNFRLGTFLAEGLNLDQALENLGEVAEGLNTVRIAKALVQEQDLRFPLLETTYQILFEGKSPKQGMQTLMSYKLDQDVGFLDD